MRCHVIPLKIQFMYLLKHTAWCKVLLTNFACLPVELFDTLVLHACDNGPSMEQSAAGCDVLPALNLLCQWMTGSSPNTWNGQLLKKTK